MAALVEYKCPCCSGAIEFDSTKQKLRCPYCDTEFDVDLFKALDDELKQEQPENLQWETPEMQRWAEGEAENIAVYTCKSCGGEIAGDATVAASSCPYCGNPVVMTGNLSGALKPDLVIPFKLSKSQAKEAFKAFTKGKRLVPKVFHDEVHLDEIKGVYVPFWLFDADTQSDIRYKATKIRAWSDSRYRYTETSYYSIFRSGGLSFRRVPVDGSKKAADDLMESIEPYNYAEAVDFKTAYLAGYLADKYDVSSDESIERANNRIKTSVVNAFAATVKGYATVIPENSNIRLSNGAVKYALLPVWILNTSWEEKNYIFAMNAQTGKFIGDLPVDKKAYHRWLWGLAAAFSAVFYLLLIIAEIM